MEQILHRILDLAVAIQQVPAPTFHEAERAQLVRARFAEEGLQGVEIDATGNVYACYPSGRQSPARKSPPLIVSAHLDTVFPINVDLSVKRDQGSMAGPGIGDNSLGVAGLFGLVWMLRERKLSLPGDLWLVANVCEEGLGNLRGIRAVVERFGALDKPEAGQSQPPSTAGGIAALAYIIVEGMSLGHVYQRGLGVRRYRINVHTAGGHSWTDYGKPSAIHELAAISTRLTTLVLPRSPRASLNVGIISGGSSVNTIAAEAMLELDLRSESSMTLEELVRQVEQIINSAKKPGVAIESELIGIRPAGEIPVDHWLVRLAQECLQEMGVEPHLSIGSTDANLPLSLGLPAVTIGLTTGGRAHTVQEFINIDPLEKGMEQLVSLVSRAWD